MGVFSAHFLAFGLLFLHQSLAAPSVEVATFNATEYREAKGFLGNFFAPRCPTAFPICPIDCWSESAVVHGYCCGCAGIFENLPVHCPNWLQCPIRGEQLCSDYRFVMDCCCRRSFF